jgi:long-chain acyl-CoA synthetase
MILGPSGQNIYPEEVETVINSQPYVVDSLVIEDNGGLTALVYPDYAQGVKDGIRQRDFQKYFDGVLPELNKELPNYAKLKKIEVLYEDFERTPKKSIKRYIYQRS